jgi:RND family efflux transporter MFP subunit
MENPSSANTNSGKPIDKSALGVERKPFSTIQKSFALVAMAIVLVVVVIGILSRRSASAELTEITNRAAVPLVNVTSIAPAKGATELVLPGTTQSFIEAAIYARTNGYLKKWYFDIGAHVRKGQLLAEIETPELDQQLSQAQQDLFTAKQNEELAYTTAVRWQRLVSDDAVSKQETEQYESDYKAKRFTTSSASANVDRLLQLQSFEKVYSPFDGVITARNTDIGALIDSGSGGPKELFHMASVSRLRIYVSVPEAEASVARLGAPVELTLDEYPNRTFHGSIVRTSDAIDQTTRTLNVEIDIDNAKDEIKTGAYVLAHFKVSDAKDQAAGPLTVPANAILFRSEGLRTAVVRDKKAQLVPITIGRDFGSTLEVTSGLSKGDKVILNPSDSLTSGTSVRIAPETREGGK